MTAGWFDDPSGRFGRRWFDGTTWTDHVVAANGSVTADALPGSTTPYAPPVERDRPEPAPPEQTVTVPAAAPGFAPQGQASPPGYGWGTTPYPPAQPWTPRPSSRYAPGPGLVVGVVGAVCVALSLFVVDWVDADRSTFLDFSKGARDANTDGADLAPTLAITYGAWAAFVLLALTVVAVVVAGIPLPRTSDRAQRIAGCVIAGVAAVLNTVTFSQLGKSLDLEAGGYLGTAGYFVVIVGFVIGARRVATGP